MRSVLALIPALTFTLAGAEWSERVEVRHDDKLALSYRAMWTGEYIVVEAAIEPGWHTFAMDNKIRQKEKLAGRPSLGIEMPTQIRVSGGVAGEGQWLQSEPKDMSNPDIQWFTWGFEKQATFAIKTNAKRSDPASVAIRGQACAEAVCKNIDVTLSVPVKASKQPFDAATLTPVRQ